MRDRTNGFLITTVILAAIGIYLALPMQHPKWLTNLIFWQPASRRDLQIKEGLDFRGGLQVLLEADAEARPLTAMLFRRPSKLSRTA